VVAHLGPTNSGKSHDALVALAANGRGTFAAPLRLLAHEARRRLQTLVPAGVTVGLRTGEERIDDDAPIVCCTTELAPLRGDTLVLDEVHWVDDPDRGWAWGRLLAGAEYRHIHLVGATNTEPLLRNVFGESLDVRQHRRLTELHWAGTVDLEAIPPGSLVVAFSRRAVLALARQVAAATPNRVGVLYGALPPAARADQIEKFLGGDLDVLCVTDVIGHGINLPARTVVVAETTKYDGTRRRPLHLWELAQIVGRAGRFGLAERGDAAVLRGVAGLEANATLVRRAVEAAGGTLAAGAAITTAPIRPTLDDLAATVAPGETFDAGALAAAVDGWQRAATSGAFGGHPWLRPAPLDRVAELFGRLRRDGTFERIGDPAVLWRLATLAVDDDDLVVELAHDLAGGGRRPAAPRPPAAGDVDLETAERIAARARGLAATGRAFPTLAGDPDDLLATETAAAAAISGLLPAAVRDNPYGRCGSCGRPSAPWSDRCDRCRGPRLPPPRRGGRRR
jgi:ATP-dependent RNA helicase SUPV3L1/SUV3